MKKKSSEGKSHPLIASSLLSLLSIGHIYAQPGSADQIENPDNLVIDSGTQTGNIIYTSSAGTADKIITFKKGTSLQADITRIKAVENPNSGKLIVNFTEGSTMSGKIQTAMTTTGNDQAANMVFFSGASRATDVVFQGKILSYGTGPGAHTLRKDHGNHVVFEQGSMKGDIEADGARQRVGYNEVIFKQEGSVLEGNIKAAAGSVDNYGSYGNNTVIFSNGGEIKGSIFADAHSYSNASGPLRYFGTNTIEFSGGSLSHISGEIKAKSWTNDTQNRGVNKITMSSTINKITGNIISEGGRNIVTLNGEKAIITGNIENTAGESLFTLNASTIEMTGNIKTTGAKSTFALANNSTLTITEGEILSQDDTKVDFKSDGSLSFIANKTLLRTNGGLTAINTIDASGKLTLNLKGIRSGGNGNSYNQNIIKGGDESEILVGSEGIVTYGPTNTNTITGTGTLTLKIADDVVARADNGGKKDTIFAEGGKNTIEAKNLNIGQKDKPFNLGATSTNMNKSTSINTITATDRLVGYFREMKIDGRYYRLAYENKIKGGDNSKVVVESMVMTPQIQGSNSIILGSNSTITLGSLQANKQFQDTAGSNSITVGSHSTITANGDIQRLNDGENNFTLGSDSTLTLNAKASGVTTHIITSLTAGSNGDTYLILNNQKTNNTLRGVMQVADSNEAMNTTIYSVTNGEHLIAELKGQGENRGVTLTLASSTGITLKEVKPGENSTTNTLAIKGGNNSILNAINLSSSQELNLNFLANTSSSLKLATLNKGEGSVKIDVNANNVTLEGGSINANTLAFSNSPILTFKNTDIAFENADVSSATSATLALDGSNNAVQSVIDLLKGGDKLSLKFSGGAQKSLKIKNVDSTSSNTLTLKAIILDNSSIDNTLNLYELADSVKNIIFTNKITVGSSNGLALKIKGLSREDARNLTFTGGFKTQDSGISTLSLQEGNLVLSGPTTAPITRDVDENTLEITNLDMGSMQIADTSSKITFKSNTKINTLTSLGKSEIVIGAQNANTNLTIGTTNASLASVALEGENAILSINGGKANIDILSTNASDTINPNAVGTTKGNILIFKNNELSIGKIDNPNSKEIHLTLENSTLELLGEENLNLSSLSASSNSLINLAPIQGRRNTKILEIGSNNGTGFKGDARFVLFVDGNAKSADKIVFKNADSSAKNASSITVSLIGGLNVLNITRSDNVMVVDASANEQTKAIDVKTEQSLIGGILTEVKIAKENDQYYIDSVEDKGAPIEYQEVASTALTINYDLYIANFNSLNKRMGELRDNANSQGVWARVFGGHMSNDFGAGSRSDYFTAQAGYDYALSVGENAKNYVGVVVAYGKSWTKSNALRMNYIGASGSIVLSDVNSNMVEVGVYNSYVADSGWYNDTIVKFDYIMSDFSLSNKSDLDTHTSNFAMVFSDEFGYRYKFGNDAGWYIDPQLEVAFGYFNQSDFNRAMYDASGIYQNTMEATQDTILTLRARSGASLGKKFDTEKGFASVYVGAFYEYDYIHGGNTSVAGRIGGTEISSDGLESNGRLIVNVGSNIALNKSTRMYIDVEKSFGDKQRTFMQFNFGARYSF